MDISSWEVYQHTKVYYNPSGILSLFLSPSMVRLNSILVEILLGVA